MSLMLEEIRQQPVVLERTLKEGFRTAERLRKLFETSRPRFIVLAARGTSDNAALFGRYLLEITTGIPVSLAAPSIFTLYNAQVDFRDSLVVAISQSGESTDTNLVLERAREQGVTTIGVTNEPRSTLASLAEFTFLVRAGREKSVAATKTYTGQMLFFYLLAHALGAPIRRRDLDRLPEFAAAALRTEPDVAHRAERYRFMRNTVVVGRGLNYANAFEFALKLMETCYVVAERFSSADFLHGPIAIIEPSFPVFLFAPGGVTWEATRLMLEKLHQSTSETMVITDRSNQEAARAARACLQIPARLTISGGLPEEVFTPIPYIIPAQLFAARLAAEKDLNPDQPRGLSKVTRTL